MSKISEKKLTFKLQLQGLCFASQFASCRNKTKHAVVIFLDPRSEEISEVLVNNADIKFCCNIIIVYRYIIG